MCLCVEIVPFESIVKKKCRKDASDETPMAFVEQKSISKKVITIEIKSKEEKSKAKKDKCTHTRRQGTYTAVTAKLVRNREWMENDG